MLLTDDFGDEVGVIKLTKGLHALVSPEDYDRVKAIKWQASYGNRCGAYAENINNEIRKMHRFILNYKGKKVVDHINRITLDNRRPNLRIVTTKQNNRNRTLPKHNKGRVI